MGGGWMGGGLTLKSQQLLSTSVCTTLSDWLSQWQCLSENLRHCVEFGLIYLKENVLVHDDSVSSFTLV